MPNIFKRKGGNRTKNGKNWVAKVRLAGYPHQSRSFFTRQDAARWAYALEDAYRAGVEPAKADPSEPRNLRDDEESDTRQAATENNKKHRGAALVRNGEDADEERTIAAAIGLYWPIAEGRLGEDTWEFKERIILGYWLRHPFAQLDLAELHYDDLALWIAQCREEGLAANTIRTRLSVLKRALDAALRRWRMIIRNPASGHRIKKDAPSRRRPTPAEKRALYAAALDSKWMMIYWAMRWAEECGMRRGEIARIKASDIDFTQEPPVLTIPLTKTVPRSFYMWSQLIALYREIRKCLGPGPYVFGGVRPSSISRAFVRVRQAAGISHEVTFHSLRYEANSWMAEAGVDKKLRKLIVGHVSDEMSDHYTQYSEVAAQMMSEASARARARHHMTPPHSEETTATQLSAVRRTRTPSDGP